VEAIPFVNREAISHTCIAACTDWKQIFQHGVTSFACGNVVTAVKGVYVNLVGAPGNVTRVLKHLAKALNPHLLSYRFRYSLHCYCKHLLML